MLDKSGLRKAERLCKLYREAAKVAYKHLNPQFRNAGEGTTDLTLYLELITISAWCVSYLLLEDREMGLHIYSDCVQAISGAFKASLEEEDAKRGFSTCMTLAKQTIHKFAEGVDARWKEYTENFNPKINEPQMSLAAEMSKRMRGSDEIQTCDYNFMTATLINSHIMSLMHEAALIIKEKDAFFGRIISLFK